MRFATTVITLLSLQSKWDTSNAAAIDEFTQLAQRGYCMVGSSLASYYEVKWIDGTVPDTSDGCASLCMESPSQAQLPYLNGFNYLYSASGLSSNCACYFDGRVFAAPGPGFDPFPPIGLDSFYDSSKGGANKVGPITGADTRYPEWYCYVYDNYFNFGSSLRFKGKSIDFDDNFGCIVEEDTNVKCTFGNTVEGSTLVAAFVAEEFCSEDNSSTEVTLETNGAVASYSSVVIEKNIKDMFSMTEKNTGDFSQTLNFCLRADLYDSSNLSYGSVILKKINFAGTVAFTQGGEFSTVDITTSVVEASNATGGGTRLVSITAYRCIAEGTNASDAGDVMVGSTLHICVYSEDTDVDLTVTDLVLIHEDNGSDVVLSTPVSSTTGVNFVTTINAIPSIEGKRNVQVVSTLMTPGIFDKAGGKTISASGTVSIEYIGVNRMLESKNRDLQSSKTDTSSFNVDFDIAKKELPSIVKEDSSRENGGDVAEVLGTVTFAFMAAVGIIVIG